MKNVPQARFFYEARSVNKTCAASQIFGMNPEVKIAFIIAQKEIM